MLNDDALPIRTSESCRVPEERGHSFLMGRTRGLPPAGPQVVIGTIYACPDFHRRLWLIYERALRRAASEDQDCPGSNV